MRIEGLGEVHSLIARLEKRHGKATGDLALHLLDDSEEIRFADSSTLEVNEVFDRDEELVPDTYDLIFYRSFAKNVEIATKARAIA